MKIFISWSGPRSRAIAEALREWLPYVINAAEPWLSSSDIEKGARWALDLAQELENTSIGVICLTRENINAPWILFEAGALSKTVGKSFVCPYLFDLSKVDLTGPLVQFQATKAEKDDTRHLVHTINRTLTNHRLSDKQLDAAFEVWWPHLKGRLDSVPAPAQDPGRLRSDREILEEVLDLARDLVSLRPLRAARATVFREFELPSALVDTLTQVSEQSGLSKDEIFSLAVATFLRGQGMDPHAPPIVAITAVIRQKVSDPGLAANLISEFTALDQAPDVQSKQQQLQRIKRVLRRRNNKLQADQVKTLAAAADLLCKFGCDRLTTDDA
jgi:hypothetical protein